MKLTLLAVIIAITILYSFRALSQTSFRSIKATGTGCLDGTYEVSLSNDNKHMELFTNEYIADSELSAPLNLPFAKKNCNVILNIQVPRGKQVALTAITINGSADVPLGAKVIFEMTKFITRSSTAPTTLRKVWSANGSRIDRDFTINDSTKILWSECGKSATLRLNTRAFAYQSFDSDRDSYLALGGDTPFLEAQLTTRNCL